MCYQNKPGLVFLFILMNSIQLFAQINEADTMQLQLRASMSGNYQQGNVEFLSLRGKLDFSIVPNENWVFKSQNSSLYQSFFGNKADSDVFSRNYIYYQTQHHIYPFGMMYISSNFRRNIDLRYFAGAGLTYKIINREKNILKVSTSVVYENTHFSNYNYNFSEYDGHQKINVWRATFYFGGWTQLFQNRFRLFYDGFWQPGLSDQNNHRTQLELGLDFPVWKGSSFSIFYSNMFESLVSDKIKQDDKILTFGLSYQLKK